MSSSTLICFRFLYAIFVCFCFGVTLFHMLAECNRYENVFNYEVEMLVTMARFVEMCAIKLLSKFLFFCVARWWCGCVGAFSLHCLWCHCVNGFPWFSVPLLSPAFFLHVIRAVCCSVWHFSLLSFAGLSIIIMLVRCALDVGFSHNFVTVKPEQNGVKPSILRNGIQSCI